MRFATTAALLVFASSTFAGESLTINCLEDLIPLDECQLREIYKAGSPGVVPEGFAPGRVYPKPGTKLNALRSKILTKVWQGKHFDGDIMTNKFFGMKMIKGQVLEETSWLDGGPVHAIDYSHTSLLFKPYRDEFREIAPGIYLGVMWKRDDCKPKIVNWFAIDTRCR
jgi:hypothetical protein